MSGLQKMANGLGLMNRLEFYIALIASGKVMRLYIYRYEQAQRETPRLLYMDRECCGPNGPSKFTVIQN